MVNDQNYVIRIPFEIAEVDWDFCCNVGIEFPIEFLATVECVRSEIFIFGGAMNG